jgi:type II secretory pathway pseudopilin PulG
MIQTYKSKKAFSMMLAIATIVIMGTLTTLIMNVAGKTMKATTQQYQKEQATLLARSYTELALLYVSSYDRSASGDCLQTIVGDYGEPNNLYKIQTEIRYIGKASELVGCGRTIPTTPLFNKGTGFDETMSIIVDVYIRYKDFDDLTTDRNVTFHRRTLQKL